MRFDHTIAQVENRVSEIDGVNRPVKTLRDPFVGQKTETIEGGTSIFREGNLAQHVILVEQGMVRLFRIMGDGRRVIIGFMGAGGLIGTSPHLHHQASADAANVVKLRRLCRLRFDDEISNSPELRSESFARMCDEMTATQWRMALLALKSEEERVGRFLLLMSNRRSTPADKSVVFEIPSDLDIADYLGLAVDAIERCICALSELGFIARIGRRTIVIRKPEVRVIPTDAEDKLRDVSTVNIFSRQAVWP